MLRTLFPALALVVAVCGCIGTSSTEEIAVDIATPADEQAHETPVTGDSISLTPENTTIQFIGNHVGDDPKPRTCTFGEFSGTATVDGSLTALEVDIKTSSLKAEMDDLTNHLKNADFFDVNQFPDAKFKSTEIKAGEDGMVDVTGDLTLLGQTHPVSFPAKVSTEGGLKLNAEFEIDRTLWGMTYGDGKVEKMVEMTITIDG